MVSCVSKQGSIGTSTNSFCFTHLSTVTAGLANQAMDAQKSWLTIDEDV